MTDEVKISADTGDPIADAEALLKGKEEELDLETGTETKEVKIETAKETLPVETTEETHVEEDLEHGEKSKEGRQVRKMRRELADFKAEAREREERLLAKIEDAIGKKPVAESDPEPELVDDPTAEEIRNYSRAYIQWATKQAEQRSKLTGLSEQESLAKYRKEYTQMVQDYVDPEDEPELFRLVTTFSPETFGSKLTDDPRKDFLTNLRNAQSHLKTTGPRPNVRGVTSTVPRGTMTGKTTTAPQVTVDVSAILNKLSPEERAAAQMFSPEEIGQMAKEGRL